MTQEAGQKKKFDWETMEVGEEFGIAEYVLTQAQLDSFRKAVDDPDAPFPTIAIAHYGLAAGTVYEGWGGVLARHEVEFFNPPIPGKKIRVTGRFVDKYVRRDLPYSAVEAIATDEDGRKIERVRAYQMHRTQRVGEKWSQPQR